MKLPRREDVRKWSIIAWFNDISKSNAFLTFCAKFIVITVLWIGLLIPVWFYLGIRWLLLPLTKIQELILLGIMIIPVGGIQMLLAFVGFIITVSLIIEDNI